MSKQPRALEVAAVIEQSGMNFYGESSLWFDDKLCDATCDAMDILRSQHELIRCLRRAFVFLYEATEFGKADELLETVRTVTKQCLEAIEEDTP